MLLKCIYAKAHGGFRGANGEDYRDCSTSCATLAVLLVAYASPGSAQGNKMSDVADQLQNRTGG